MVIVTIIEKKIPLPCGKKKEHGLPKYRQPSYIIKEPDVQIALEELQRQAIEEDRMHKQRRKKQDKDREKKSRDIERKMRDQERGIFHGVRPKSKLAARQKFLKSVKPTIVLVGSNE